MQLTKIVKWLIECQEEKQLLVESSKVGRNTGNHITDFTQL